MSAQTTRREWIAGATLLGASLYAPAVLAQAKPRVIIVGGGFAGASAARALARNNVAVTLVEPNSTYTACPFSNEVVAGLRPIEAQRFTYAALKSEGIAIAQQFATKCDPAARTVTLSDGSVLAYDRLLAAPGIEIRFDALSGYDEAASEILPHAWRAGPQTLLLRAQLEAMPDGGTVLMSVPANPYRCPPGPYERASLIAHYLKTKKPRSKLIILDAKDAFSKQKLFEAAWADLYPGLIEWVGLSTGGKVTSTDPASRTLVTDFARHKGDVVNLIPPQRAGTFAVAAGLTDRSMWCPIDPVTFESKLQPNIHVIGDACIAGGMPKSAFAANAQAKAATSAILALFAGRTPDDPRLINTCYSLVAPDYGISVAGVYKPANGLLTDIPGAGGVSPANAPRSQREQEATYARSWFKTITSEAFG